MPRHLYRRYDPWIDGHDDDTMAPLSHADFHTPQFPAAGAFERLAVRAARARAAVAMRARSWRPNRGVSPAARAAPAQRGVGGVFRRRSPQRRQPRRSGVCGAFARGRRSGRAIAAHLKLPAPPRSPPRLAHYLSSTRKTAICDKTHTWLLANAHYEDRCARMLMISRSKGRPTDVLSNNELS